MDRDRALGTIRAAAAAAFVWLVWAGMLACALGYVALFGTNSPYQDEWHSVAVATGHEPLTIAWLWSPQNEHRIPLPRLLHLGLFHLAGEDFRGAMCANVLALGALAAAFVLTARFIRGRTEWCDAFFPLVLLHWGQGYNLLFGYQILVIAPVCFAGAVLAVAARHDGRLGLGAASLASVCVLLLPLCGGLGIAWVPALALWLAFAAERTWRARSSRGGAALVMAGGAAGSVALLAAYFAGFEGATYTPRRPGLGRTVEVSLEFLSTAFGPLQTPTWWGAAALILAVCLSSAAWAAMAFCRSREEQVRVAGFLAILAGAACQAAAVGWGRAGFGPGAGLAQRYATMTALALCCAYLASLAYARGWVGGSVRTVLLAVSVVMLWPNTQNGLAYARELRGRFQQCERDVRRGVPPAVLANHYSRSPNLLGRAWQKKQYARELVMLRDAKVGWYRWLRDDPDWREVPLPPAAPGRVLSYRLPAPTFVCALRLKFRYSPGPPFANLRAAWRGSPSGPAAAFAISLPRKDQDDVLFIWVDGPVFEFSVDPGDEPSRCRVSDVTLLVPHVPR